jgi:hypothetical protein
MAGISQYIDRLERLVRIAEQSEARLAPAT